jgi:hypothetical protein
VIGRAVLVLGICALTGCGEPVLLDLFAPQPTLQVPRLDAAIAVVDAGKRIADTLKSGDDGTSDDDGTSRHDGGLIDARLSNELSDGAVGSSSLILRYDFSGDGTELVDRVGNASARVLGGARLDDSGELALDGVDDYVDLPNGTLAALESATVVAWITWGGGVCWQRVFDFGHNDMGEDKQGSAVTSLFVTLSTCPEGRLAGMAELPSGHFVVEAATAIEPSSTRQVALSFDAARSLLTLYLDGVRVAETSAGFALAQLGDVNAWLGRSQWVQDYFARVRYDEFRIYDRALSRTEVRALFQRGADRP